MSAMTRVHNPAPYEIVVDSDGHILPGRASTAVSMSDMVVARLVQADRLVIVPEPASAEPEPTPLKARKKSAPAAPAVAEDGE